MEQALLRVDPPTPAAPAAATQPTWDPSVVPVAPTQPARDPAEASPIRVERGAGGVTIRAKRVGRTLHTLNADGFPTTKELTLEGFRVSIAGPGNFRQERTYGLADQAVLGTEPGLADGLYKFSVSPRLQRISGLPGKSALAAAEGGPVILTRNGRNALDPDVQAAATLPRMESASGTFRIANGQLVQPDSGSESDLGYGIHDEDRDR